MKTTLLPRMTLGLLCLALASCESQDASSSKPSAGIVRGQAAMVSLTLKVEAIDLAKRTITLKSSEGNVETFIVGQEVKRFAEIKPGDSLVVQYHVGVMAELRPPTVEEKASPIKIMEGISRAPSSVPPTGALTQSVRVVTTIDALDAKAVTMTLKGPLGGTLTFKIQDTELFPTLKVGETIVATFGEQLVLAIEPK